MFAFDRIIQDLIAKGLQLAGTAIAGTGIATGEETTAIMGGVGAIIGIIWNAWTNRGTRKLIAITAEANDTGKTTATVIAEPTAVKEVGTAAPAGVAPASPNKGTGARNS